jgi:hypothetical protein
VWRNVWIPIYQNGWSNANPILDTREYTVEFLGGSINVSTVNANTKVESLLSQIDAKGLDRQSDGKALKKDDVSLQYLPSPPI